jgi:hypothetical protein
MPDFITNSLRQLRIVLRQETSVYLKSTPENFSTWLFPFASPIHSDGHQTKMGQKVGQNLSAQATSDGHLFFVAETGSMRKIILTSFRFKVTHSSKGSPLLLVTGDLSPALDRSALPFLPKSYRAVRRSTA